MFIWYFKEKKMVDDLQHTNGQDIAKLKSIARHSLTSSGNGTHNGNGTHSPNSQQIDKAQLAIAEAMAMKLHEEDRRKKEERKRKREESEKLQRSIKSRIDIERKKVEEEEKYTFNSNREIYALFNDLQGISHECVSFFLHHLSCECLSSFNPIKFFLLFISSLCFLSASKNLLFLCSFNIAFETPELVVVGMQSDGKSSFIEGLLGFQFNIVESNILIYLVSGWFVFLNVILII
jgi:hypothetical protein